MSCQFWDVLNDVRIGSSAAETKPNMRAAAFRRAAEVQASLFPGLDGQR